MRQNTNRTTTIVVALALALGIGAVERSDGQGQPPVAAGPEDASGVVPGAYPLSRYEGLWKNSLFGPGGADPFVAAAPSNLSLVGVFEVDGVGHAVLMDTSNGVTEEVNSAGRNKGGSRLAKIESSPDLMKTRVQVERGGSLIWVGYKLGATAKPGSQRSNAERLRALREKERAIAAAANGGGSGSVGRGEIIGDANERPGAKAERPRTVVLPSTIPVTGRPK